MMLSALTRGSDEEVFASLDRTVLDLVCRFVEAPRDRVRRFTESNSTWVVYKRGRDGRFWVKSGNLSLWPMLCCQRIGDEQTAAGRIHRQCMDGPGNQESLRMPVSRCTA